MLPLQPGTWGQLSCATFSRTGGLPCLITHSCMSAASPTDVGGLIFCISATPQPGSLFPIFHAWYSLAIVSKTKLWLKSSDNSISQVRDCFEVARWRVSRQTFEKRPRQGVRKKFRPAHHRGASQEIPTCSVNKDHQLLLLLPLYFGFELKLKA